jgi:hypothetical protein
MVFSTESTAFTKKEKRTKKERKAAAANSLISYINPAPYTYKGMGSGAESDELTPCGTTSCIEPPDLWVKSFDGGEEDQ